MAQTEPLTERLAKRLPFEGNYKTAVPGVAIHRFNLSSRPRARVYKPMVIFIVQGEKLLRLDGQEVRYKQDHYSISGLPLQLSSGMTGISSNKPYLAISVDLEDEVILELIHSMQLSSIKRTASKSTAVIERITPEILDCLCRLLDQSEKEEEIDILAPMIKRKLFYRVLQGPFGSVLANQHTFGTQQFYISKVVNMIRENLGKTFAVKELPEQCCMSILTFHRCFKEVMKLTPLQYQKNLKLQEAQNLMLYKGLTVQ